MTENRIGSAVASDLTNAMTDFSVDTVQTDGVGSGKESEYQNSDFTQQLGYFTSIPEINAAINAKSTWTIGKGFKSDSQTTFICDSIRGNGEDTFNTILENMIRTYYIGGDSFAEIIRDNEGNLINIKPLDPSVIKIVVNQQGLVIRYEQSSKHKSPIKKFKPEQILHLARNRVADQIHGVSVIDAVETLILARNEAIEDYKRVMHRNIDPLWIFHMDTDDTAEIAAFKAKQDAARGAGENMYIPKGVVVPELAAVAANATMSPLSWIEFLGNAFYEAVGVPKIILGGSGEFTEASAKIAYLAFQQNVEEEQLFIEEQVGQQLGLTIELEFPASLENELLSDNNKDGAQNIDQSELNPTSENT
jgi:hypothetical protein